VFVESVGVLLLLLKCMHDQPVFGHGHDDDDDDDDDVVVVGV